MIKEKYLSSQDAAIYQLQSRRVSLNSSENCDSCVISGNFAYVLKLTRIFGMAPVRFESHEKGFRISVSKPMCIYSYILVFFVGSAALLGRIIETTMSNRSQDRSKLTHLVLTYLSVTVTVSVIASVVSGPKRMKNLIKCINVIAAMDKSLSTRYSGAIDLKLFLKVIFMSILLIVLYVQDYFIFYNYPFSRVFSRITYHISNFLMMNMYLQLVYIFITIRARVQCINEALTLVACQWSSELESIPQNSMNACAIHEDDSVTNRTPVIIVRRSITVYPQLVVSPSAAIQRIAFLRGSLCDTVNSMNRDCGLPIITTLLSMLGNFVVILYNMIFFFCISDDIYDKLFAIAVNSPWFTMYFAVMVALIDPCHNTKKEDKNTKKILCLIMRSASSPGTILSLLEMFGFQVMLKPILYEPLDMCTLNRPLMISILGAISTYLVILLKF